MTLSAYSEYSTQKSLDSGLDQVHIPPGGKEQVNLSQFRWSPKKECIFALFLPCASEKPYYRSSTHSYFHKKMDELFPAAWHKILQICTISEVIGIIPEDLEDKILIENAQLYWYEHYPAANEGDVERTKYWLSNFIQKYKFSKNFAYLTSKTFRLIVDIPEMNIFPQNYDSRNPIFEFRRSTNVHQVFDELITDYCNVLVKRYQLWGSQKNSKSIKTDIINLIQKEKSVTYQDLKSKFNKKKGLNLALFHLSTERSNYEGGIFLQKTGDSYLFINAIENSNMFAI
jgi:hypothetical protein